MSEVIERFKMMIAHGVKNKVAGELVAQIEFATVKSVQSDGTCTVQMLTDNEGDVTPGITTSLYSNMKMKPAANSSCLVAHIMNEDAEGLLVWCDKIEEVSFNGDAFGGLIKLQELQDNLDALKSYCTSLKSAVANGLNAVGVSTAANGPAASASFNGEMASKVINFSDMENKTVKHGEG